MLYSVMYLQGPREFSQTVPIKYISIIVCNTCNYMSAKPLTTNSSDEIANHLLEVIQESGRIPSLLLSDSGAAQSLGNVERTINDLRNLVLIRNYKIMEKCASHQTMDISKEAFSKDTPIKQQEVSRGTPTTSNEPEVTLNENSSRETQEASTPLPEDD